MSDEEVLAAVGRVMQTVGPTEITLSAIGTEAGLTAGALVQRFGSRKNLLLAVAEESASQVPALFERLRADRTSPLATVIAYGECVAGMGASPASLANHLAYLQVDLADPDFRRHARAQADITRRELAALLQEATAAGELRADASHEYLAHCVEVTVTGSLITWGLYQEGAASEWVRRDLESLLESSKV